MVKTFKTISLSIIEKLFILILFGYTFFSFFLFFNFVNNYESNNLDTESCYYFVPPNINQLNEYQVNFEDRDIYVLPDIKNINCIGKVVSFELNDDSLLIYNGTNSKFINYLIFLTQFSLLFIYLFILNKRNYQIMNITLFVFFVYFFFYSLDTISYFLFLLFPTIFYFLNNKKEIPEKNSEAYSNKDTFYLSILFFGLMIIQFSSHHYETIDWDINAFLVTAMDIGRGNLPLENQFENKPPLLFFVYYLLGYLAGGDLLPVKILNDFVLFLSVILMYFISKTKTKSSFEAFISSSVFILFMSNYWFHPGYSEIFSLSFIAVAYLLIIQSKNSFLKTCFSGVILALATLVNIGSSIFLLGFSLIIFLKFTHYLKNLFYFYFGFSLTHLLFIILYSINGLFTEYLISTIYIPTSYVRTEFLFFSEIKVFLDSLLNYNFLIFLILIICLVNEISKPLEYVNKKFKLSSVLNLSELILLINSLLFYFFAAKGYYHHLIFFLFFVCLGINSIPTAKYRGLLVGIVILAFLQTIIQFSGQTFTNISNLKNIEESYPLKRVSESIKSEIQIDDKILSLDNVIILYYLDKPNISYLVHPALYYYEEVTSILVKYGKISSNEIDYQISLRPKFVEGNFIDTINNDYKKIQLNEFENNLLNYFQTGKKIHIYKRLD